eukprot:7335633-Ditylum_brightwellii.AAC.1
MGHVPLEDVCIYAYPPNAGQASKPLTKTEGQQQHHDSKYYAQHKGNYAQLLPSAHIIGGNIDTILATISKKSKAL